MEEKKKTKAATSTKQKQRAQTAAAPKKAKNSTNKKSVAVKQKATTITKKQEKPTMKNIKLSGFHDLQLNIFVFDAVEKPKAAIVIVHGMQEHGLRYKAFAEFLNANGFIVVVSDLRGHGGTIVGHDGYGRGEKDIFAETLKDQTKILEFVKETYSLPVYLFGHSYGSMLTQNLIQLVPFVQKAVICGTTNGDCATFKLGSFTTTLLSPFKKKDARGGLVEKMCINSYGKKFERGNWFTRDEAEFEKYLQDEFCGGSFPFSFYKSLIKNMRKTNKGIGKIGTKKLFLIAGDNDPVGEYGKQVKKLYKLYLKNNVDTKMKLYEGARHELVNEINKKEVMTDVVNFFNE